MEYVILIVVLIFVNFSCGTSVHFLVSVLILSPYQESTVSFSLHSHHHLLSPIYLFIYSLTFLLMLSG